MKPIKIDERVEDLSDRILLFSKVYSYTRKNRVLKPTLYYRLGVADCCSLLTQRGSPNVPAYKILVFDKEELISKLIEDIGDNIMSPLNKNKTIKKHSEELVEQKISSYPSSIHKILSLNEFFDLIYSKALNEEDILNFLNSYPKLIEEYELVIKKPSK